MVMELLSSMHGCPVLNGIDGMIVESKLVVLRELSLKELPWKMLSELELISESKSA
jgi:hypothetical protein